MKKIAIIGTAGVPAQYGGFETLAHHLVLHLANQHELSVYCSGKLYPKDERVKSWNGAKLIYLPFNANGIQSIIYDIVSILHALFYADALIVLGVSGGILFPFIQWITSKKIVVNIDGLEWKRDKWNKWIKWYLKFSEKLAVRFSDADITDNYAIKRYTAQEYGTLSTLVAYGGDHVKQMQVDHDDEAQYPFLRRKYAFKVCRIEPENNVSLILEAFSRQEELPLVMVGNWNKSEYGQELKTKYSKFKQLHLLDPIYDQEALDKLRSNCHVYIHGHSAGGTNPSLVEAMFLNLPVLAFDVSYNRASTYNKALYFKDISELQFLLSVVTDKQLDEIATDMYDIAKTHYVWSEIARQYLHLVLSFDYDYRRKPVESKYARLDKKMLYKHGAAHLSVMNKFYE